MDDDDTFGGWTFEELNELADIAARTHRAAPVMPYENRAEFALAGILDRILDNGGAYTDRTELIHQGWAGITTEINSAARIRGRVHGKPMPNYEMYHRGGHVLGSASFEDCIDELLTLRTVWPQITTQDRQTLEVRAWQDSDAAAAADLHVSRTCYVARLMNARIRAKTIWFWPDTPPKHYGASGRRSDAWGMARAIRARVSYARKGRRRRAESDQA